MTTTTIASVGIAGLTVFGALFFTIMAQRYVAKRARIFRVDIPLPDWLHYEGWKWLSDLRYIAWTDWLLKFELVLVVALWEKLDVFLVYMSVLWTLRALLFSATILPKCSFVPRKEHYEQSSVWEIMWLTVSGQDPHSGHENDLMFSGHVAFWCMTALHLNALGWTTLSPYLNALHVVASVWVIVTRCHYTIDVFFAWVTTDWLFSKTNSYLY